MLPLRRFRVHQEIFQGFEIYVWELGPPFFVQVGRFRGFQRAMIVPRSSAGIFAFYRAQHHACVDMSVSFPSENNRIQLLDYRRIYTITDILPLQTLNPY